MADDDSGLNAVELATELTIAWLGNPNTRTSVQEVPGFLDKMHGTISALLGSGGEVETSDKPAEYPPATSVRKSLASKDHIISMIDGKPYKTLRRHLTTHGLTPADYRERYGLRADYPMVAENYSESRRAMAKQIGLGRKQGQGAPSEPGTDKPAGGTDKPTAGTDKPTAGPEKATAAKPAPRRRGKAAAAAGQG